MSFINANTADPGQNSSVIGFTTTTSDFTFNITPTNVMFDASSNNILSYPIYVGPGVWLINSSINLTSASPITSLTTNININGVAYPEQTSFSTSSTFGFTVITSDCMTVAYVSGQSIAITISAGGTTSGSTDITSVPGLPGTLRVTKIA